MNALELVDPGEDDEKPKVSRDDLRRIISAWKVVKGIPTEGIRSKNWDQANWARVSRSAKTLLLTFGDWRTAVDCIGYVYSNLTEKGLTCGLETVVKRSDDYWEELNRK